MATVAGDPPPTGLSMLADGEEEHAVTAISAATPAANPATDPATAFIVPSSFIQVGALCRAGRHDGGSSPIRASVSGGIRLLRRLRREAAS